MEKNKNQLGSEKINILLRRFATPSIIAMMVGALYNIIDQFFIGNYIGMYGNAATNVALPFTTICMSWALMSGVAVPPASILIWAQARRILRADTWGLPY